MELRAAHYSAREWSDEAVWEKYFRRVEDVFGARLGKIGTSDPPKRKAGSPAEVAAFVSDFGKRDESRWIFGSLDAAGIEFSTHHFRDRPKGFANSLNWHFASTVFDNAAGVETVAKLFEASNELLAPFYSICDLNDRIAAKKRTSGAVNLQAELIGVFWLTFFDSAYIRFFGREKFEVIRSARFEHFGGVTLRLGASPTTYDERLRGEIEGILGPESFVDTRDLMGKPAGRHALTFERINPG